MTLKERARKLQHEFYSPSGDESELEIIERHMRELIKEKQEACAMIADEMKAELSQRPEKLQYGRNQIEVAEYIAQEIRAMPL